MINATEMPMPQNGWWPEEANAPMTQMYLVSGRPIGQVVRAAGRWRSYSMIEMNKSGTTGKPLNADGSVETRELAKNEVEAYAETMAKESTH
jgi:hypothetical protein